MTPKPTRGGTRPNAGRKPVTPDEPTVNITLRVPASWRDIIAAHQLRPVIRAAIGRIVKKRKIEDGD